MMHFLTSLFGGGPAVNQVDAQQAQEKLKQKPSPFLLDVRQPEEYHEAHIAGARLIPLGELPRRMNELPREREILVVCRSGSRSSSAVRQLAQAGFNPTNMRGGLIAWSRAGLPLKQGK